MRGAAAAAGPHCSLFCIGQDPRTLAARAASVAARGHKEDIADAAQALASKSDPPTPSAAPLSGPPANGKYREGLHGQNFTFGSEGDPVAPDPDVALRHSRRLSPCLSVFSANGTDTRLSDIRVSATRGAMSFLHVSYLVVDSGFSADDPARGSNSASRLNARGAPGNVAGSVASVCQATHYMAQCLRDTSPPHESVRQPTNFLTHPTEPDLSEHDARCFALSVLFVQLGCSFYVLLRFLDVSDHELLFSTRTRERLASKEGTTLCAVIDRIDSSGSPGFARVTVTEGMKDARERYNIGAATPEWARRNHKSVIPHADFVSSALSKQVHLRHLLPMLPVVRFLMPTFLSAPLGVNVNKNTGKERLIHDTSHVGDAGQQFDDRGDPVLASLNACIPKEFITTCVYGSVLSNTVSNIYRMRIAHPSSRVWWLLIDTNAAYQHMRLHHAIIPLLAIWVYGILFFSCTLTFGATYSAGEYSNAEESVLEKFNSMSLLAIAPSPPPSRSASSSGGRSLRRTRRASACARRGATRSTRPSWFHLSRGSPAASSSTTPSSPRSALTDTHFTGA